MKRYTFIILSLIATLSYSCSGLEVEGVWVKPPQLVQAYINPEIHGLGAEGLEDGLVVLLPCNVGQYSILSSDPKAYITNQTFICQSIHANINYNSTFFNHITLYKFRNTNCRN